MYSEIEKRTWKRVQITLNIFAVYLISLTTYILYESFWVEMNELSILPPKTKVTCILLLENNKRQLGPLGDRQNFEKLRWEKKP